MKSATTSGKILVVDDDRNLLDLLRMRLESANYEVTTAVKEEEAIGAVKNQVFDLSIVDLQLAGEDGISLMEGLHLILPEMPVIILTAYGTIESAVEAMKRGAYSYLTKPFEPQDLLLQIDRALESRRLNVEIKRLKGLLEERYDFVNIVARSEKMKRVLEMVSQIAKTESTVYIHGESGTGKELIAKAIHLASERKNGPFVAINCAALPEALLESELFGHEKGSFTGALTRRIGKFEQCHGGTLFLDEIGDMTPATQAKILRVLQDRQFERLGGAERIHVDVRLIVATNKDLEKGMREGGFRQDLYYRLQVVTLHLPPLRERKEDIPELVRYFLHKFSPGINPNIQEISPQTLEKLVRHRWTGNVRELENAVKRALVTAKGTTLLPEDFPLDGMGAEMQTTSDQGDFEKRLESLMEPVFKILADRSKEMPDSDPMSSIEKILIKRALQETRGNQVQAALLLGMSRNTLRSKIERYRIKKDVTIIEGDE